MTAVGCDCRRLIGDRWCPVRRDVLDVKAADRDERQARSVGKKTMLPHVDFNRVLGRFCRAEVGPNHCFFSVYLGMPGRRL